MKRLIIRLCIYVMAFEFLLAVLFFISILFSCFCFFVERTCASSLTSVLVLKVCITVALLAARQIMIQK